jgi:hypothetical protein
MAEFQWWLLIVGLVVGGAIVALLTMDTSRGDEDLPEDERAAEATFIATQLAGEGRAVDDETVAAVLRAHRAYLRLPAPDAIVPVDALMAGGARSTGDGHPDDEANDVGHRRGADADRDLPPA